MPEEERYLASAKRRGKLVKEATGLRVDYFWHGARGWQPYILGGDASEALAEARSELETAQAKLSSTEEALERVRKEIGFIATELRTRGEVGLGERLEAAGGHFA